MAEQIGEQISVPRSVSFDRFLFEALDDGMKDLLGESIASVVLYHLEKNCSLKIENMLKEPACFAEALEKIFGQGALLIETKVAKELHSKLELEFQTIEGYGFADYVKNAKERHNQLKLGSWNKEEVSRWWRETMEV